MGAPAEVVERALAPLVDNALRFARTRVGVRATEAEGEVVVAVSDDGLGPPSGDSFLPDWRALGGDVVAGAVPQGASELRLPGGGS